MPRVEVPADVLHAAQQTPRSWALLPVLAAWYLDARTGRIEVDVPPDDGAEAPLLPAAMPDEALRALATVPALWPITLELARWTRDGRTGRIEVEVTDGASRELRRVERVGVVQRTERLALGRNLNVPEGVVPLCPTCQSGAMEKLDHGNRYFCAPCDRLWTLWDLKRKDSFLPPGGRA